MSWSTEVIDTACHMMPKDLETLTIFVAESYREKVTETTLVEQQLVAARAGSKSAYT